MVKHLLTAALAVLVGCGPAPSNAPRATVAESTNQEPAQSERQEFQVRGVVQEVKEKQAVIKHEEIPGYMPAMTMPFDVKDTNELSGLKPMDQVEFKMVVTDDDGWIENIRKTGAAATNERPHIRIVRDVEPLVVGDKMPNYTFTNSLGETVSFSQFAGSAYAFTFIFTRCPFPTFCPRMNSNFALAQEELQSGPDAPTNWFLVNISFDPDFDTPARLKEYSATYEPDPEKWHWVTGAMIDIDAITEQFGVVFAYENNTFNHNLRTVVVDKNGVIRHIFIGNEWKASELVEELIKGAKGEPIVPPEE